MHAHTYMHRQIYLHTYSHIYGHIHIQMRVHSHIYVHSHICTYTYTHTLTYICIHTHIYICARTHIHRRVFFSCPEVRFSAWVVPTSCQRLLGTSALFELTFICFLFLSFLFTTKNTNRSKPYRVTIRINWNKITTMVDRRTIDTVMN